MIRRRRTTITREGWYYLAVLAFVVVGAMLREINLLMVMAGMMIGPLLLNWRIALAALRPLTVSRRVAQEISAGDPLIADITVQSRAATWFPRWSFGSWAVVVEDAIRSQAATAHRERFRPAVLIWRIRRGQAQRVSYRGCLPRRGRYQLGPLKVSTSFPLGLVRRTMLVAAPWELTVLPRLGRLTTAWERFYRRALSGSRGRQPQQAVLEGEFHSLRDWRAGDAQRRIHWRTSARRRAPVVRQFEQQQNRDLVLFLDLWAPRGANHADAEAVERAVSFAATIVHDVCRRGGCQLVLGIAGSTRSVLRGAASQTLLSGCLAELAVAEPGDGRNFGPAFEEACGRPRPGAGLLVLSTRMRQVASNEPLASLRVDPRQRSFGGLLMLDAHDDEMAEYFTMEDAPARERKP